MTDLGYVFLIIFAYLTLALAHYWGAKKMKKEMMREHHVQLNLVRNLCSSILREKGGAGWETFEPSLKHSLNITEEACHHNCDLNRNHHFQLGTFIKQQLHLIYLLSQSEDKTEQKIFDQLYFDDQEIKIKDNG
jgi:hypothetical protein